MQLKIEYLPLEALTPYERNARKHEAADVQTIKNSIKEFEMCDPIGIWGDKNIIVEGHGRLMALKELGRTQAPCIRLDHLTDEQRRAYALAHNKTAEMSEWDFDLVESELADIEIDMEQFGFDLDGAEIDEREDRRTEDGLFGKFVVPPFTVFDARQGYWLKRKREWHAKIQDDAQARSDANAYQNPEAWGDLASLPRGVSLLDPVLSEIINRYFVPNGTGEPCKTFDVFAGDTVFGFVSATLGNRFTGIELRQEQATFNQSRADDFGLDAKYICDDGRNVLKHIPEASQDLLFSCPPYFDLEVYSDNENDASAQETFEDFYAILDTAFANAIKALKNDRFAVIVVGGVRDKKTGFYYDFTGAVKDTFERNGMSLYNDAVLVTPVGTAAMRAGRYMNNRKLCNVHQNVLVFYKGDPKNINKNFAEIEIEEGLFDVSENE